MANTVVFIKEQDSSNVYGGYTAVAKAYPTTGIWIAKERDPNMFVFAIEDAEADAIQQCTLSSRWQLNKLMLGMIAAATHSALVTAI
jgi:hypothetical protein